MKVRHLPEVKKREGEWRMACTCGEAGEARATRRMARADQDQHLNSVCDVPAAERCRMPRQHGLRPWERCELCAGQISIFDLDGMEVR